MDEHEEDAYMQHVAENADYELDESTAEHPNVVLLDDKLTETLNRIFSHHEATNAVLSTGEMSE